jgi:sec-independent protein translocase protein TatA
MGLSWWHILIVLVLFMVLFGRGKISELMSDVAHGIKSFKRGIAEDAEAEEPKIIEAERIHKTSSRGKAPRKQKTG